MPIDKDILIQEVAKRHHVLLNEDDPILVTVTLNEIILKHYLDQTDNKLSEVEQSFYEMQREALSNARATSEKIITSGATYLHENLQSASEGILEQLKNTKLSSSESKVDNSKEFAEIRKTNQYLLYLMLAILVLNIIVVIQLIIK